MDKIAIGANTFLYPMPAVIVGANVKNKANYLTVAYCGTVQHIPPMISISLEKEHYTNAGIEENGTFSVNIPSVDMVKVTDYCGIVSGQKIDKSAIFNTFYGKLKNAPMISACPLNLECRLVQKLNISGSNEIFIGEIIEAYAAEQFLTKGLPDIKKINPIIFSMHDFNYWTVGEHLGRAFKIGKEYKPSGEQ